MRHFQGTQDTERFGRQTTKQLKLLVTCAADRAGRSGPRFLRSTGAWPPQRQQDEQSQESQDDELSVKEMWNHGSTPLHGEVMGAWYSIPRLGRVCKLYFGLYISYYE
jgi:hypothetical protein